MKATSVIFAAVLTLHAGILFAGNDNISPAANEISSISMISLAPATPAEATFEDMEIISMAYLVPSTPAEATFDDMPALIPSAGDLSPVTPGLAEFEDVVEAVLPDNGILAPVTPAEADFE
jgi:hypothetical protein